MDKGLEMLKQQLLVRILFLDKQIEIRNGHCYFDESKKIGKLHSEASAYKKVIEMIDEIQKGKKETKYVIVKNDHTLEFVERGEGRE